MDVKQETWHSCISLWDHELWKDNRDSQGGL